MITTITDGLRSSPHCPAPILAESFHGRKTPSPDIPALASRLQRAAGRLIRGLGTKLRPDFLVTDT